MVIVGVGVGGISQRLRPRGEGGRRNADPTNAFALLSLAVVVDNSLALYAQLQFLLELRPREARPENSSIYRRFRGVRTVYPSPATGRSASFRLRFRFVRVVRAVRAGEAKLRGRMTSDVPNAGPPG